jgi:O-antigen ligase
MAGGVTLDSSTKNLGGRIDIWRAALEASTSDAGMLLIGAGTGGADHAIGTANPDLHIAKVGEHDVLRANAHNGYLYWLVSFGVIGLCVATVALAVIASYAVGNDWRLGMGAGSAMMAFFLLTSVTLIASRLEITSIALSALTLGYILPTHEEVVS